MNFQVSTTILKAHKKNLSYALRSPCGVMLKEFT